MKIANWTMIMFAANLALSGCAIHPKPAVELPGDIPPRYAESSGNDQPAEIVDRWWLRFRDERLNQLMERMFRTNLELEQSFARLQQARSVVTTLRSARFPAINVDGQAGRSREPAVTGDVNGETYRLSGAAAFEIDLWGKLAARSEAAGKRSEATLEELKTLYLGLSAQLADLYFLAVEQRAQLALTDETIRSFAETTESVEERYRLGIVPAVDVYQARQNLMSARAGRHVFAANLAAAEHAISVLLGEYPEPGSAGGLAVLPEMPPAFPSGLPSELIERRPDLKAALRRVEAADAEVAAAIADRFPSVNLLAQYGTTRQDVSMGLIEGDFWSFLGNITLPVLDAGRRRAEVERNRALVRERVAAYRQAVLTAFREVEDALAENRETGLRIASLAETEKATGATLRLSLDRYFFGVTDYLPVLSAQRAHFDTQSRLLAARRQLVSARISLARALGSDWMRDEIEARQSATQDKVP